VIDLNGGRHQPCQSVREPAGNEGWELASAHISAWLFKREVLLSPGANGIPASLTEDHAGHSDAGENGPGLHYQADGNHVEK